VFTGGRNPLAAEIHVPQIKISHVPHLGKPTITSKRGQLNLCVVRHFPQASPRSLGFPFTYFRCTCPESKHHHVLMLTSYITWNTMSMILKYQFERFNEEHGANTGERHYHGKVIIKFKEKLVNSLRCHMGHNGPWFHVHIHERGFHLLPKREPLL